MLPTPGPLLAPAAPPPPLVVAPELVLVEVLLVAPELLLALAPPPPPLLVPAPPPAPPPPASAVGWQTPAVHVPPGHAVPSGFGAGEQPMPGVQVAGSVHGPVAQVTGAVTQAPAWQVAARHASPVFPQRSPSPSCVQVPSATAPATLEQVVQSGPQETSQHMLATQWPLTQPPSSAHGEPLGSGESLQRPPWQAPITPAPYAQALPSSSPGPGHEHPSHVHVPWMATGWAGS